MRGTLRTTVARPTGEVFDFLADLRNEAAWNPRVVRIDKVSGGPIGAGTVFDGSYKGLGALRTTLTDFERPGRLSFASDGPRMGITGTFALRAAPPVPGQPGTEVTDIALDADLEPRGLFRYLAPLMGPVLRRQNAAAAVRLKRALEAQRP